ARQITYQVGDKVMLHAGYDVDNQVIYRVADHLRRGPLLLLALLFVGITVVINRLKGVLSLASMALTFAIIFIFVLPQILAGRDPTLVTLAASLVIIPVTYYLSHVLNRKTSIAVIGTLVALAFSATLAQLFINVAHLSGFASDEAGLLSFMT